MKSWGFAGEEPVSIGSMRAMRGVEERRGAAASGGSDFREDGEGAAGNGIRQPQTARLGVEWGGVN